MSSIDLKSMIIGILSCAMIFILMGFSIGSNQKYQIACGSNKVGSCLLLNTQTGKTKFLDYNPRSKKVVLSPRRSLYISRIGDIPDF